MLAALLFLLPSNICGSKKDKHSKIETENLPIIDVSDELYVEHDVKTSGPSVKTVERRETAELTDDYFEYPLCGDKPMYSRRTHTCYCGNRTLNVGTDLRDGDYYCCVPPSASEVDQCKYAGSGIDGDLRDNSVRCENGELRHKTEPCQKNCWNSYRKSEKLAKTATLYCLKEDYCLPLDQMCSGVYSEEAELCEPDILSCIGHGYNENQNERGYEWADDYTKKSLATKLGKDHGYCLKINNDQVYDSISRSDEQKVLGTNQPTVNYTGLVKCKDQYGTDGIHCSDECKSIEYWCAGEGEVCKTPGGALVSVDTPALCRNATFWRVNNFTCDWYPYWYGLVWGAGARCSADYQHCTLPWYRRFSADTNRIPSCVDKSDQVFPINSTCRQHNLQFLQTYRTIWCSGNNERRKGTK